MNPCQAQNRTQKTTTCLGTLFAIKLALILVRFHLGKLGKISKLV